MEKNRNRFPGAKPFVFEEHEIFYGRKHDIEKLYELLKIKRMITLYAESGIGKSSLVNAGLIPKFHQSEMGDKFIPVKIRFGLSDAKGSPLILLSKIIEELNTYKHLLSNQDLPFAPAPLENNLWYLLKLFERNGYRLLLFFDQLEEVFTYSNAQIDTFKEQLFSIFSGIPPQINEGIEKAIGAIETQQPDKDYLARLDEDLRFINAPLNTLVLFVVREDKLGFFNSFTNYFPDILKDIYKLCPLSRDSAKEAIELPAQKEGNFKTAPFIFSPPAIEKLLSRLAEKNGTYDPFTIQLTCRYIERNLVEEGSKRVIHETDIPAVGVIEKDFIEGAWKALPPAFYKNADVYKDIIAQKLIAHDIKRRISVHESNWIPEEVVAVLITEGLLKRDRRGEVDYIEISHDRLVQPLLENFHFRKQRRATRRRRRIATLISVLLFTAIAIPVYFYLNDRQEMEMAKDKSFKSIKEAYHRLEAKQKKSDEQATDRYLDSAQKIIKAYTAVSGQLAGPQPNADGLASNRNPDSDPGTGKSLNVEQISAYLDSATTAAYDAGADNNAKLESIARLRETLKPVAPNSRKVPDKVYRVDVFYDERTLPQSEVTADSIVNRLKGSKRFVVRKKLLTEARINLNKTWDIPNNRIRYENNRMEKHLADSLARSFNAQDYLKGERIFTLQPVKTRYKSPNYISIFVKN